MNDKNLIFLIITLLSFTSFFNVLVAQGDAQDVVLMLNGDEKEGKVLEINEDEIKFVHKGESLNYALKKSDIMKITFSSGRIEFINKPIDSSPVAKRESGSLASHHNKVAILPFSYIIDKESAGEEVTYQIQSEAFSFLNSHVAALELQDPNTTNALLIKGGISDNSIRGYTMGEICNMLDVEMVIQGTITQTFQSASTSSYKSNQFSVEKEDDNRHHRIGDVKGRSSQYSSSTQRERYQTAITMSIYTDKGQSIYSDTHTSFWDTPDAYKMTLRYLLKRTPIYRK